jgi:aminoglycoside phosphotransferase
MSGASVYRSSDGAVHAKCVGAADIGALRLERDKIEWLATTSIPGPRLVDWMVSEAGAALVISTVRGIPACDIPRQLVARAAASMACLLADLHALPIEGCPFVRRLDRTVAAAADAVRRGAVDITDFDYDRLGRTAEDLLAELIDLQPRAAELERDDLVVCHGDPCLPNLLIDPETGDRTGLIDLGRLGVADRYLDLALTVRSMSALEMNDQYDARDAATFLNRYGISEPDPWRLDFYRLLDEFF